MKKCRFIQTGLLLDRPVFFNGGVPEKGGTEAAEAAKKAAELPGEMEDRSRRQEVYDRALAKADEYLKSEDPKKKETGENLKKEVELALADEKKLDVSMAQTTALGLLGSLERIAKREIAGAKPLKEEEVAKLVKELEATPKPEWVTKPPEPVKVPEPTPAERAKRKAAVAAMTEAAKKASPEEKPAPPVKVAGTPEAHKPPKG